MLLLIQAGVLAMIAFVPTFADAYRTPAGQVVMAVLLAATIALLVWMRRLALGRPAPRFLQGGHPHRDLPSSTGDDAAPAPPDALRTPELTPGVTR
ncbi:hypothetical protein BJF78_26270 [Pseudonocardia sp. CNS-139]|nr:hypothetical protein BJF78_26270 [Pseudonocardia sp. CNS-139]